MSEAGGLQQGKGLLVKRLTSSRVGILCEAPLHKVTRAKHLFHPFVMSL